MSLISALAIYVVIWWIVLFVVLPFGVRTQDEEGAVVPGTAPSAPVAPMLVRKAIATTLIATVIFALLYWLIAVFGLSLDDFSFLGGFFGPLDR